MGYLVESLANSYFKKDTHGKTRFYPYGIRGFLIESEEKVDQIRKEIIKCTKRWILICNVTSAITLFSYSTLFFLPAFIKVDLAIFISSLALLLPAMLISMLEGQIYIFKIAKNLKEQEKMNRREYIKNVFEGWKNDASHYNFFILVFSGFTFLLLLSLFIIFIKDDGVAQLSSVILFPIQLSMAFITQTSQTLRITDFPGFLFFDFINTVIMGTILKTALLAFVGLLCIWTISIGYMIAVKVQIKWNQFIKKLSLLYSSRRVTKTN